ncbi:nucleoside hydrolase [Actinoplanes sp. NPDC026623]|uniref:nucleoside hydrolase n=1 Tax=Actinoplanes sp. NPDC026623 TaxID=3155610 RepID=UPI0033FDC2CD
MDNAAHPIIIDCDPGHDDALALLLAAGDPRLRLLGVTTVAGNQTLDKTTRNALRILALAGVSGVPVAAGCDRPLAGTLVVADDIHGASGLDGPDLDVPVAEAENVHAVELMRRLLVGSAEPVTLIATGPLTNVASLLREHPEVIPYVRRVVFMGGSTERGNTTPYGEFNIVTDPEAADIVLRSGLPQTMIGLNVTHRAPATTEIIAEFRGLGTRLGTVCAELMTYFARTYHRVFGFEHPPVHDPIAVAAVIDPSIVHTVAAPVAVELTGTHTRGATVVDLHRRTTLAPNADVAVGLEVDAFWRLLMASVRTLGRPHTGPRVRLRVLPDYHCWALWISGPDVYDNIAPDTLPLTAELAAGLDGWADEYTATLNDEDPKTSGFASPQEESRFIERGRDLARQVRAQLDDTWTVTYFDLGLRRDVEIAG